MPIPSARQLLDVWEAGRGLDHTDRALLMLRCAGEPDGAGLSIGRRDGLLLDLRERLFGARIDAVESCPACAARLEVVFDIADVCVADPGMAAGWLDLAIDDYRITARPLTSDDLLATRGSGDVAAVRARLLERSLVEATEGGQARPASSLPQAVLEGVAAAIGEADPQAEVELELSCAECGHQWRRHFDIVEYLWSEIEQHGRQMLRDVHLLARAYGWDEDAVLRLSPWRRGCYLEMIADG